MVLVSVSQNPKLAECTPFSILAATMQAAQMGLEPGPLGHCALIPFRDNRNKRVLAQFQLMYKGMVQLAYNTGELLDVAAHAVYTKDQFRMAYGKDDVLEHIPNLEERGEIKGFYAYAHLKGGGFRMLWMSKADVDKVRDDHSIAYKYNKEDTPWGPHYEEMGCKTALKRLWKLLPISVTNQRLMAQDETVKAELRGDMTEAPDASVVDLGLTTDDVLPDEQPEDAEVVKDEPKNKEKKADKAPDKKDEAGKSDKRDDGSGTSESTESTDDGKPKNEVELDPKKDLF